MLCILALIFLRHQHPFGHTFPTRQNTHYADIRALFF